MVEMDPSSGVDGSSLRLVWTDLHGIPRGTVLPSAQFDTAVDEGVGFASGVSELTLEPGFVTDARYGPEHGDVVAVADSNSVAPLSWREDEAIVFSDLKTPRGHQFDLCSRSVLRDVVSDLETAGYVPRIGVEVEFSLLRSESGSLVPDNDRSSYDLDALDQTADQIAAWNTAMETAGYELLGIHAESQPGQFELDFRYDDPVTIADGVVFCRHMLKSVARRHGLTATMMPRPHTDEDANGMHLHLSLWDKGVTKNRFASDDATLEFPEGGPRDGGLTDEARYFVGGILDHAMALTAICAPTVNSYKRLLPGRWAPINVAWGPDNRTTAIRIPPELGTATRIEYRVPDSAANPYLAFAATFAAGLDGLRSQTEPDPPTLANAYEEDYDHLPRTLWAAIDHLESDAVLRDALGTTLVDEFVKLKRDEFDRSQENVSSWERAEYVDTF